MRDPTLVVEDIKVEVGVKVGSLGNKRLGASYTNMLMEKSVVNPCNYQDESNLLCPISMSSAKSISSASDSDIYADDLHQLKCQNIYMTKAGINLKGLVANMIPDKEKITMDVKFIDQKTDLILGYLEDMTLFLYEDYEPFNADMISMEQYGKEENIQMECLDNEIKDYMFWEERFKNLEWPEKSSPGITDSSTNRVKFENIKKSDASKIHLTFLVKEEKSRQTFGKPSILHGETTIKKFDNLVKFEEVEKILEDYVLRRYVFDLDLKSILKSGESSPICLKITGTHRRAYGKICIDQNILKNLEIQKELEETQETTKKVVNKISQKSKQTQESSKIKIQDPNFETAWDYDIENYINLGEESKGSSGLFNLF